MRRGISSSREILRGRAWGTGRSTGQLSQGTAVKRATLRAERTLLGALVGGETSNRKFKICHGSNFPLQSWGTCKEIKKCELTGQCLNIHSINRHYRQGTGVYHFCQAVT